MREFTEQNTTGYTEDQLNKINAEWNERAKNQGLEPHTDEYDFALKCFSDEISRR